MAGERRSGAYYFACESPKKKKERGQGGGPVDRTPLRQFSGLIQSCSGKQAWSEALRVLELMRHCGLEPNASTYCTGLAACERGRRWEVALSLLAEMHDRSLATKAAEHTTAVKTCLAAGAWERSLEAFAAMRNRGVLPDRTAYHSALRATARTGKWECAVRLLEEMRGSPTPPDTAAYAGAVAATTRAQQWQQALGLLQDMRSDGLEPSPFINATAYQAAAAGHERENGWAKALHLLSSLPPDVCSLDLLIHKHRLQRLAPVTVRKSVKVRQISYLVWVWTSDVLHAGTDANVFMNLFGSEGESTGPILLETSAFHDDPFERNHLDCFSVHGPDVGEVTSMIIGHDNAGIGADWHLDKLVVEAPEQDRAWCFLCNRWFSARRDDFAVERLLPLSAAGDSKEDVLEQLNLEVGEVPPLPGEIFGSESCTPLSSSRMQPTTSSRMQPTISSRMQASRSMDRVGSKGRVGGSKERVGGAAGSRPRGPPALAWAARRPSGETAAGEGQGGEGAHQGRGVAEEDCSEEDEEVEEGEAGPEEPRVRRSPCVKAPPGQGTRYVRF